MTYTFDQLKEDVRKEAEALKIHATKEERERIRLELFVAESRDGCIYGMTSGDCFSCRAIELIQLCCVRYFENLDFTEIPNEGFAGILKRVSGATVKDFKQGRLRRDPTHYSAIEAYIMLKEARISNLISYLRGETDNLEL
jgi:hypothetical protein